MHAPTRQPRLDPSIQFLRTSHLHGILTFPMFLLEFSQAHLVNQRMHLNAFQSMILFQHILMQTHIMETSLNLLIQASLIGQSLTLSRPSRQALNSFHGKCLSISMFLFRCKAIKMFHGRVMPGRPA